MIGRLILCVGLLGLAACQSAGTQQARLPPSADIAIASVRPPNDTGPASSPRPSRFNAELKADYASADACSVKATGPLMFDGRESATTLLLIAFEQCRAQWRKVATGLNATIAISASVSNAADKAYATVREDWVRSNLAPFIAARAEIQSALRQKESQPAASPPPPSPVMPRRAPQGFDI